MFLSRLTDPQRQSFMALVTKMALADGKVAPEEVAVLDDIAHALGNPDPVSAEEIFGSINIEPFDTEESRILTVLGMLVVAYADYNFHVDESTVLDETITAFALPDSKLNALKVWATKQADLMNELHDLIE